MPTSATADGPPTEHGSPALPLVATAAVGCALRLPALAVVVVVVVVVVAAAAAAVVAAAVARTLPRTPMPSVGASAPLLGRSL